MARIRGIKPGFFTNDLLAEVDPLGRILFAGLWCHADRAGRLEDRPRKIKAEVLPYDACDVDDLLNDLVRHGFIDREDGWITINNWRDWQPFDREVPSDWPELRQMVFERDGFVCRYCGERTDTPHCDHIIPVSRGGTNDMANLATACPSCNLSKNNKTVEEWAR